jgi:hypothetical protein
MNISSIARITNPFRDKINDFMAAATPPAFRTASFEPQLPYIFIFSTASTDFAIRRKPRSI